jgi:hypothetical protein
MFEGEVTRSDSERMGRGSVGQKERERRYSSEYYNSFSFLLANK